MELGRRFFSLLLCDSEHPNLLEVVQLAMHDDDNVDQEPSHRNEAHNEMVHDDERVLQNQKLRAFPFSVFQLLERMTIWQN